jgi:hypothetical protein
MADPVHAVVIPTDSSCIANLCTEKPIIFVLGHRVDDAL